MNKEKRIAELEAQVERLSDELVEQLEVQDRLLSELVEGLDDRINEEAKVLLHQEGVDTLHQKSRIAARHILDEFDQYKITHPDSSLENLYLWIGNKHKLSKSRTKKIILQAQKDYAFNKKVIELHKDWIKNRGEDEGHFDFCYYAAEQLNTEAKVVHNIIDKYFYNMKKHGP